MLHTYIATLALAAIVFVIAGCGGSSKTTAQTGSSTTVATNTSTIATTSSTSTAPPISLATGKPLSKAQWIKQGDTVCAHLITESAAQSAHNQPQIAQALTQVTAYERAAAVSLAKLVPPDSKSNDWQLILTGLQEEATNSEALVAAAEAGEFKPTSPLVITTETIKQHMDAAAKHDGFIACSRI